MRKSKKVRPSGSTKADSLGEPKSKDRLGLVKAETAGRTAVLIPQEHGGALLSGGTPGNKGGGRTASELRGLMRRPLAKLLPVVERIAEATDTQEVTCPECDHKHQVTSWLKASDKLKAVDLLARYGIGTQQEIEHKGHITLHACQPDRQ